MTSLGTLTVSRQGFGAMGLSHSYGQVVPIPGTRHIAHLEANWAAGDLVLDADSLAALDAAFPRGATTGDRYPAEQLKLVPPAPAPEPVPA